MTGPIITDDMRAVVQSAHLCFAATVTPEGRPNLSPKGTVRVYDEAHLFFLDIASPGTRANLQHSPWIELNVVDQLSRRGYRFFGRARIHSDDDVYREEGHVYPFAAVVLIAVLRAAELVSPGYLFIGSEQEMRSAWRPRRAALDAEFDSHAAARPFNPPR
jgi:uncharacterized protein